MCNIYSYEYPLETVQLDSQRPLQKPEQPEHRESVHPTYMENDGQIPIDHLDPTAWQLSIQTPSNFPPAISRPNHEEVYHPSFEYRYPAACGVLLPQQYSLAPPPTNMADELPAFNSISGGE